MTTARVTAAAAAAVAVARCCCGGSTHVTARVLLFNESYPNMAPATVRYVLELRDVVEDRSTEQQQQQQAARRQQRRPQRQQQQGRRCSGGGGGATNCVPHLIAHAIESSSGGLESLPVSTDRAGATAFAFLPFNGPTPTLPVPGPLRRPCKLVWFREPKWIVLIRRHPSL